MTGCHAASFEDAFERALGAILARVSVSATALAVAYSGGLDSAVLLRVALAYARKHGLSLYAFHVHHGLSTNADAWLRHCELQCAELGVKFDARRVSVTAVDSHGVEQAARIARYTALGELCRCHGVPLLMTGHHQDDQAETVLLQLLRGAGVAGLSGMAPAGDAVELLGADSPLLIRPLLDFTRLELTDFAVKKGIQYIEDESNDDVRYSRNALRHVVMPLLHAHFNGFQKRLARVAMHAQSSQRLMDELATEDWRICGRGDAIVLAPFAELSKDRQNNLLRYWIGRHHVRMPSTAWLSELRTQLLSAAHDSQVRVIHPDCEVRRHRGKAFLIGRPHLFINGAATREFRWSGESCIRFPEFGGTLHFDVRGEDCMRWLREQSLEIRYRQGGEKLKLAADRPTRSLKHHYQDLDIPVWERRLLPLVLVNEKLVFAAGIGMNSAALPENPGAEIHLRWERDAF